MYIKQQNSLKICQQSGIINEKCRFCPKLPRFTLPYCSFVILLLISGAQMPNSAVFVGCKSEFFKNVIKVQKQN